MDNERQTLGAVGPPLNKKLFPVYRPGGLKRAYWNFFFPIFNFFFFYVPLLYILHCKKLMLIHGDSCNIT